MTDEILEDAEEAYFSKNGATLRIFGRIPDPEEITKNLGISPTQKHARGDRRDGSSDFFEHDMWSYKAPVSEDVDLDVHLQTLWAGLKPHREYLKILKESLTVGVFCQYTSNWPCTGIEVSPQSLEMFVELEIPFGLSIIN